MLHGNSPLCVKTQLQPDLGTGLSRPNQLSPGGGHSAWPLFATPFPSEADRGHSRVVGRFGWYSMKPRVLSGSRPPLANTTAKYGMTMAPTAGMAVSQPR